MGSTPPVSFRPGYKTYSFTASRDRYPAGRAVPLTVKLPRGGANSRIDTNKRGYIA
jgi:hypothetical protein